MYKQSLITAIGVTVVSIFGYICFFYFFPLDDFHELGVRRSFRGGIAFSIYGFPVTIFILTIFSIIYYFLYTKYDANWLNLLLPFLLLNIVFLILSKFVFSIYFVYFIYSMVSLFPFVITFVLMANK